ncbi:hypothetical protein T03_17944 [Trichinella britovi]|uniref:Uncharacterized protein n=1 Tax=Trichinella britovi TaxID=45882 RepID=A0A0V1C7M8_TRIBR|nr:hypothetical protein T03_17944 [Trichinella britovi]
MSPRVNTIRLYESYRVRVRFGASTIRLGESTILSLLTGLEANLCERVIK